MVTLSATAAARSASGPPLAWVHGEDPMPIQNLHAARHDANTDPRPYWRRAHHDWRFWIAMVLMSAAITIYVLTEDLRFLPRSQQLPPVPASAGGN